MGCAVVTHASILSIVSTNEAIGCQPVEGLPECSVDVERVVFIGNVVCQGIYNTADSVTLMKETVTCSISIRIALLLVLFLCFATVLVAIKASTLSNAASTVVIASRHYSCPRRHQRLANMPPYQGKGVILVYWMHG